MERERLGGQVSKRGKRRVSQKERVVKREKKKGHKRG